MGPLVCIVGYLDFIAWDLPAVLTAAQAFFEGSDLPYAHFHAFRRDVGGVPLLDEKEPEPDIHEETGSLLSTEDIEILESFDEGTAAYFGKMLDWLENFIKSGVEEDDQAKTSSPGFTDCPLVCLCLP